MRLYFYKTPLLLKKIYKPCVWNRPTNEKIIYLTFDDGPVPGATSYVLEVLEKFDARATFFMVGENVEKHPDVFEKVLNAGHAIGNHTHNHLKGWNTNNSTYFENISKCEKTITASGYQRESKPLFRPPYGRITTKQLEAIRKHYEIIMWQVLSGDFDLQLNHGSSWKALKKTQPGDIIVFHDSDKYISNVETLLPDFLQYFTDQGYRFESL